MTTAPIETYRRVPLAPINLNSIPLVIADGGVVSAGELQRLLGLHGIHARDVTIYRLDRDPQNVFRWTGVGINGTKVAGQLVFSLAHDSKHVVVQAEIALASRFVASQKESEPTVSARQRLLLIRSIARRAFQDLRDNPRNVSVVLAHLNDLVEIATAAQVAGSSDRIACRCERTRG